MTTGLRTEVDALLVLLRKRTVSGADEELRLLRGLLPELYPKIFAQAEDESFEHGVQLRVRGRDEGPPVVVLAHYDVVPVTGQAWSVDPFAAEVVDGRIIARGAIDDKGRLAAVLTALERLLSRGEKPARTIVVALGDDEEISGRTAAATAERLRLEGDVHVVLDEGPGLELDVFRGVSAPLALVGIGERGSASVTLEAHHGGGHASMPAPDYATRRLARALTRIHDRPFPAVVRWPLRETYRRLAGRASGWYRLQYSVFAALPWLAARHLASLSPEHAALVRTTAAATVLEASTTTNVLPVLARAVIDLRVNPGGTLDAAVQRLQRIVAPDDVRVIRGPGDDPSALSDHAGDGFATLERAILAVWPDATVLPTLMSGATDARHYAPWTSDVFRFTPIRWEPGQRKLLHAADEYITLEQWEGMVTFYEAVFSGGASTIGNP